MRQLYQPPQALLAVVLEPALLLLHCCLQHYQQLLQLVPCWHLLRCWQLQVRLRWLLAQQRPQQLLRMPQQLLRTLQRKAQGSG
jgi:hypothetical protein